MWRVSAGVRLSLAFPPSSSFVPAVLGSKRTAKSKQSGACFGNQHRSCPRRCGAVVGQRQRADCDSVLLHARVQVVKTERIEWKGPFVCVAVLKTEKAIVPYVHTYLLPRESHTACAHTWQLVRTPGSLCEHLAATPFSRALPGVCHCSREGCVVLLFLCVGSRCWGGGPVHQRQRVAD